MTSSAHLLAHASAGHYRAAVAAAADRVAGCVSRVDRPFTGVAPATLADAVERIDLDRPLGDTDAALAELEQVYLTDAVWFHHPRYLAHLNCPVAIPALSAETVASAVNSSLDTWDQSAGATVIERHLIDWTAHRLGFGDGADGVFTSGGTQSNLHALLLAREEACRLAEKRAADGAASPVRRSTLLPRMRVFASEHSHFSVTKAAKLLGMDDDAVVAVPCDRQRRMRPDALAAALHRCRRDGAVPVAVVATAGTTDFGSIDPLAAVAAQCRRAGVWLHVDAAYGCGLLVSSRRRLLDGIEQADSVTVDFHKSFFQPVAASAVLVRDAETLRHATYHADYLNPAPETVVQVPNQVDKSLQTTRRFDALKVWLTLRVMGPDALGALFDRVVDRAQQAWQMLAADSRFQVVTRPQLSTLVFRYAPGAHCDEGVADQVAVDRANRHARAALAASGGGMVAGTTVDGRQYLKCTILNPDTTAADVAEVCDLLARHAAQALATGQEPAREEVR